MSARQTPLTCHGHTRPVVHLAFSGMTNFGYFLISACKDGTPMLRQGDTGDWIGTFEGHKGAVWGAALNQDGSKAATGGADFTAKIWDTVSGVEQHSLPHNHIVKAVDFNVRGDQLVTGSNDKMIRVFDLKYPDVDPIKLVGHDSALTNVKFYMDNFVVSSSDDKTVRLWDLRTCAQVQRITCSSEVCDLDIIGSTLTLCYGSTVAFGNVERLEIIKEVEAPIQVLSASLKQDESTFVCGGADFRIYKYDYKTGIQLEALKGHFGPVHCVRFFPDGELYASGSEDGTLRLWQTTLGKNYGLWMYPSK